MFWQRIHEDYRSRLCSSNLFLLCVRKFSGEEMYKLTAFKGLISVLKGDAVIAKTCTVAGTVCCTY